MSSPLLTFDDQWHEFSMLKLRFRSLNPCSWNAINWWVFFVMCICSDWFFFPYYSEWYLTFKFANKDCLSWKASFLLQKHKSWFELINKFPSPFSTQAFRMRKIVPCQHPLDFPLFPWFSGWRVVLIVSHNSGWEPCKIWWESWFELILIDQEIFFWTLFIVFRRTNVLSGAEGVLELHIHSMFAACGLIFGNFILKK